MDQAVSVASSVALEDVERDTEVGLAGGRVESGMRAGALD